MKNKNWFWGLVFMLSAIFVIASQIWSFDKIGIMSILATVFLAALVIDSLIHLSYFGIFMPLAVLYMIYSKPLMLIYISPWLLITSAVLICIGFSLLFPRHPNRATFSHDEAKHINRINENIDDNNPYAKVILSSASKYLHSECLQSGHFISHLGVLEVYFDQVQLSIDGAEVFIDCNLGSIYLYIPKHWNVVDNFHNYLGEVSYSTEHTKLSENAPRLTLAGNVVMGEVKIIYI
jgi:hypothetical protein